MKSRKPTRAKRRKESPSNHENDIYKILTRENGRLQRRYKMARHCLRNHLYVNEALAVLRRVSRSSEIRATQKDVALRLLDKYQRKTGRNRSGSGSQDVMKLPQSWKDKIGVVAGAVEWIPDSEWERLASFARTDRKKTWLPTGFSIKNGEAEEGDDNR